MSSPSHVTGSRPSDAPSSIADVSGLKYKLTFSNNSEYLVRGLEDYDIYYEFARWLLPFFMEINTQASQTLRQGTKTQIMQFGDLVIIYLLI